MKIFQVIAIIDYEMSFILTLNQLKINFLSFNFSKNIVCNINLPIS